MAPILWSVLALITLAAEAARGTCPSTCKCNPEANYVDCSNAGLERIPWNLPDPSGLKQLDLRGNKIKEIITEIVSYSNLESLDLSNNEIIRIDDFVLNSLPKLKYLFLQHNHLDKLSSRTLDNLKSLVRLDLSHNQLETLGPNVFSDLSQLVQLDLSSNYIHSIDKHTYFGLSSLKYIALNSNRLSNLSSDWWKNSPHITMLLFDMNSITAVEAGTFSNLPELQSLSIEGNGLTAFSHNAFGSGDRSLLEKLSLKQNKLQEVPSEMLKHLPNLLTLDLSQNQIRLIDLEDFKGLHKLQELYLNNLPNLEVIGKYSFSDLVNLQSIQISSNPKLHKIETDAFLGTPNLRKVDLHGDGLTTINSNLFDWLNLDILDLRQNPWTCNCKLSFLGDVLKFKMNQSESPSYIFQDVKCSSPEDMVTIRVMELDSRNCMGQPPERRYSDKIIIAVICMFALCVVLCLFVLVWRTRNISFNTAESNRPRVAVRRRLRRHRSHVINGSCTRSNGLASINEREDRISITDNGEESDEVFDDNKSDNISESGSRTSRKVSFSNFVQVRRCSVEYEEA